MKTLPHATNLKGISRPDRPGNDFLWWSWATGRGSLGVQLQFRDVIGLGRRLLIPAV